MKALPSTTEDRLEVFSQNWERSSNLRDVLSKLPGHLVLQSGLSAKRNRLIEQWDRLESPSLDGSLSEGALEQLLKWNHDAEVSIAYIIQLGKEEQANGLGRAFAAVASEAPQFELVSSIEEVDFVSDNWCWPWAEKRESKPKEGHKLDKKRLIKYGAIGAIGLMALVTYLDEDQ
jgi:hypothetical protein